jgi:hypothetical protein
MKTEIHVKTQKAQLKRHSPFSFLTLGLAACVAAGAVAYAAVIVDDEGVGFVGKGDVQTALGWNNAQLQANAGSLKFWFTTSGIASWGCEWWTGPEHNRVYHSNTQFATLAEVSASIGYDARANKKGQITGFNLNGFTTTDGTAPGTCTGGPGEGKQLVEGSLLVTSSDEGTLWVQVGNDDRVALPMPIDQGE